MSRVVLVLAMVLSLWPAGAIALVATSDSTDSAAGSDPSVGASASTQASSDDASESTSVPPVNYDRLKRLGSELNEVLSDFKASSSLSGTADQPLASRARDTAQSLDNWEGEAIGSGPAVDRKAIMVARRERAIAAAVASFADAPSQARLDRFNAAIKAYNRLIR